MSLRGRVQGIERRIGDMVDPNVPVTVAELLTGKLDENTRKRFGPEGCRRAAEQVRELLATGEDVVGRER